MDSYDLDYNIIVFTETWLKADILNSEVLCNSYTIYRKDRVDRIGGGVLIAVSCSLSSELIPTDEFSGIEFIAVSVMFASVKMFITCSYIPPSADFNVYKEHLSAIEGIVSSMGESDIILTLGDFNLTSVSWHMLPESEALTPLTTSDWSTDVVRILAEMNMFQINSILNMNGKVLDLILTNESRLFQVARILPISTPEDNHHPTICISFSIPLPQTSSACAVGDSLRYCFKRCDFDCLNSLLLTVDWNAICNCSSVEEFDCVVNKFYDILFEFVSRTVPREPAITKKYIPWSSRELCRLKNLKSKLFKKFKRTGSNADYGRYSVARHKFNIESSKCYKSYLLKVRDNFKNDPKSFYNFVNLKRRTSSKPSRIRNNGIEFSDDQSIANCFADFFETTYSSHSFDSGTSYPYSISSVNQVVSPILDASLIQSNLQRLKPTCTSGPDGIPNLLLKGCSKSLVLPLTLLFNSSLRLGYFPVVWKRSYLTPLHKSGSLLNVSNYRGIAKLSAIPKLFEKIITNFVSHNVAPILHPCQHGFRKGHSTITNLLQFSSEVINGFVCRKQTDVIYTDFSKAFDKVNHKLLLFKLNRIGFNHNFLNWLSSYLVGREQVVSFENCLSRTIHIPSGVPQGSHLGPVLFLLFINDLPNTITNSRLLMFADDVKIFLSYSSIADCHKLQDDLDRFVIWCDFNCMELNLKKCKHMCFSRSRMLAAKFYLCGSELISVDSFIDLGFMMDRKLNFNNHIITMVNKAYGVLCFMKRWAKEFTDPYTTKQLFTSLVRPILEYGSVVWDPQYDYYVNKIESVQKQFLLFCLRNLHWASGYELPSYNSRLNLIKLPTLKSRRTMMNTMMVYKIIRGVVPSDYLISRISINVPFRPSRHYQFLHLDFQRYNYACGDPIRRMCADFNSLFQLIDFSLGFDALKSIIIFHLNMQSS